MIIHDTGRTKVALHDIIQVEIDRDHTKSILKNAHHTM